MKNSQKGFVVPLLVAIIAILVVGGGVYIYESKKVENPVSSDVQMQQSNQVPQMTDQNTVVTPATQNSKPVTPQTDTSFKIISPKAGDSLIIGGTYTVKFQNLSKGSFVQGWLQNKNEVNAGTASIGVIDTGRDGNPSSNVQIKVPSQWCGGECGAIQYVATGQYRLLLRVYPNVQNPSYQTYYSDYFSITAPNIAQPTVTLLSPNGGEMWQEGNTYQIKWTSQNISLDAPGYVALTKDGSVVRVIKSIALNGGNLSNLGGSFSWTLPQEFVSEASPGKFKILISSTDNKISDYSDNQFTIFASGGPQPISGQPSITVLYPNVGEVLNNGGRDNIATVRWTTSNFGSMNVTVGLLNKNGDWIKTIASDIPNTGNYNWRMDQTIASGEYKIAVTSPQSMANSATGPVASDLSDGTFVISTRLITSGKTFVTLVSPNGGEVLTAGNKITIKWSSLGEKPTSATISLRSNARCPYGYSCTPLPNSFTNIAEISGNDLDKGEYEWTVNKSNVDSHGNGYLIGVMIVKDNLGNANYDDSDSSFTIN